MARYGYHHYEAGGMEMGHLPRRRPMGMDPNYRGAEYGGQRMSESPGAAPYGRYRAEHAREFETQGGYSGPRTGAGMLRDPGPARPSGPMGGPRPRPAPQGGGRSAEQDSGRWRAVPPQNRGARYGRDFPGADRPWRLGGRGEARGRGRYDMFDASRPLRYDAGMNRYGGYSGGGFSEGFLGSGL